MIDDDRHITVKDWASDDQPREKLHKKGAQTLSNAELLAILVRTGVKNIDVLECCKRLLARYDNDLNKIAQLSVEKLSESEGIGEVKAITILAAIELGKRRSIQEWENKKSITSPQEAFNILQPMLCHLKHEEVWILLLDKKNCVIDKRCISKGGLTASVVDVRVVMGYALQVQATGMFLAHNHPSGNPTPSKEDINLTKKINDACKLLDIRLLDHIIVAHDKMYSFLENGYI